MSCMNSLMDGWVERRKSKGFSTTHVTLLMSIINDEHDDDGDASLLMLVVAIDSLSG